MAKNKIKKTATANKPRVKPSKHFLEKWLGARLGGHAITLAQKGFGTACLLLGALLAVALFSHDATDPSLTTQSSAPINNWLGFAGAVASDLILSFLGRIAGYGGVAVFLLWGIALLSPITNADKKRGDEQSGKTILKRLSFLHFWLFWLFMFFLGAAKVILLLVWGRYIDTQQTLDDPAHPMSVLENFWRDLLVTHLAQNELLGVIAGLALVFLGLLLFLLSGMSFAEWRYLLRWVLSVVGFFFYAIFYAVATVLGVALTAVYKTLVMILPMVKVFLPRPSSVAGAVAQRQAMWKRIWRKLWHNVTAPVADDETLQGAIVESAAPDNQTLTQRVMDHFDRPKTIPAQSPKRFASAPIHHGVVNRNALPPIEFLQMAEPHKNTKSKFDQDEENQAMANRVSEALAQFGAAGRIVAVKIGPVITLYEFEPEVGIKNAQVIGLAGDLARALSATAVRIAPIAGRNVLGIEVPNSTRDKVFLGELVASSTFQQSPATLPLILGKNILGSAMVVDLSQMPHLLISGTTGSGKSVAMNGFLLSLLYRHTPETLRLILIDPKMLELSIYQHIPHLLSPVVTDPKKSVMALLWATREMERRYKLLSELGVRNLADYRKKMKSDSSLENLPTIVIMVDEMADLMLVMGKEVEVLVQRLAQMARAAGIHLIMATQRPSVDVITGTIKANFPTRLSYALPTRTDSRTILGVDGAEQLLGMGDFLIMTGGRVERGHAPFTTEEEVKKVTDWWRAQGEPQYLPEADLQKSVSTRDMVDDMMGGGEDMYQRAVDVVRREKKASTSFLQRHLQIGYNRAATLMDQLEKNGVVTPANHSGKREVL
ncbi:MAG: DNA translocase FtsK 4TM domain-containing protein [Hydrotalea sp.]|nr:DNA translocase FtsK 4TM domain-containing protein [Hydrotalea sp.]